VLGGLAVVAGLSLTLAAYADPALDDALARISAARASMKTLTGPFTQVRTIGLLATSVRSQGTMYLQLPDRLRWELEPPDDIVYWITPEGLAYRSRTGHGSVPPAQARLAGSLEDLRTLLAGDLGKLRTRYALKLAASSKPGETVFEATPLDPAAPLKKIVSGIAADGTPTFTELYEGGKDKTRIEFGALKRDVPLDPALMRPPP
jgi:outer membrane lipoprotein-sorting protein